MADHLSALAASVEARADALRTRGVRLLGAAADAQWQSLAAQRFRQDVDHLAAHMRVVAGRVDGAAAALREHARAVAAVEQLVERPIEAVVHLVRWLHG